MPRTTSTHWFSSSGLEQTLASRLGSDDHVHNQDEERPSSDIPGDQEARRFADVDPEAQRDIRRDHEGRSR